MKLKYCKNCLFAETKPDLSFDENGISSACISERDKHKNIDWQKRKIEFEKIINNYKKVDFISLVNCAFNGGLAAASIYHFTQYTPNEVKRELSLNYIPVRI